MKASFFEPIRYVTSQELPAQWPVVKQLQQFHDEAGVGVVDLSFQSTSADTPEEVLRAIKLFGKEVLPRLHEIDG